MCFLSLFTFISASQHKQWRKAEDFHEKWHQKGLFGINVIPKLGHSSRYAKHCATAVQDTTR